MGQRPPLRGDQGHIGWLFLGEAALYVGAAVNPAADWIDSTSVALLSVDLRVGFWRLHEASGRAEPPSIRADVIASNTRALVRYGRLKSLAAGGPI